MSAVAMRGVALALRSGMAALAGVGLGLSSSAWAAEEGETQHYPLEPPERMEWSFAGPMGAYDPEQLRRGLDVYREVCRGCHGLSLVAFRTLADPRGPGLTEEAVRAIAASYEIRETDAQGQPVTRPGRPADRFPNFFPTPEAAAAVNNGAVPPDLSLMAKARGVAEPFPAFVTDGLTLYQEGGADYIHALLTGYDETPPEGVVVPPGTFYNPHFAGGPALAMPPVLFDEIVPYPEGVPQTPEQYARDVSAFLMWAAEPHLERRKHLGLQVLVYLVIFAGLMYLTRRRLWAAVH